MTTKKPPTFNARRARLARRLQRMRFGEIARCLRETGYPDGRRLLTKILGGELRPGTGVGPKGLALFEAVEGWVNNGTKGA